MSASGRLLTSVAGLVVAAMLPHLVAANVARQNEQQTRVLEVRMRQVELRQARAEHQRISSLFDQGLASRAERDAARAAVETAELRYQMATLSLLNLQPRLSVRRAVKLQNADGTKSVKITVSNLSATFDDTQLRLLSSEDESNPPIPKELLKRELRDVYVSIRALGASDDVRVTPHGTTVGLPYERKIESLKYGESRTLEFRLLRDLNNLRVVSTYQGGEQVVDLQLEQGERETVVSVTATQVSQEVDLGNAVDFNLSVERSSLESRSYPLKVINLPRVISARFIEPQSEARLSQVNFSVGTAVQHLTLRLSVPERATQGVSIDQPIKFWCLVMDPNESEAGFDEERLFSDQEVESSRAGRVLLELTPRGVGRLSVTADSLFFEVGAGDRGTAELEVHNDGTRRLDNIEFEVETPPSWMVEVVPSLISSLEVNQRERAKLMIDPPAQVIAGDYEVRLKTKASSFNRPISADVKVFRVSVQTQRNLIFTLVLVAFLILIMLGILWFGLRAIRR